MMLSFYAGAFNADKAVNADNDYNPDNDADNA